MPGVINTGSHPKALWPGVHAFWGQSYAEHSPEYPDLYDIESSSRAYEEDVQVTSFGLAPRKPEGAPLSYDGENQGWISRYLHIAYALGYKVTYEELADNLYQELSMRRASSNAFSMNQTVENIGAAVYNDAFTGSVFTHADGRPLVDTAHVNSTGGTFSNALSPAADLSEAALEDVCVLIMGFTNDRGLLINLMPKSLHVARQRWHQANRILQSVLQSDTTSNNINVLKATNAFPGGVKLNHYFTNAHPWFVRTNAPNGMKMFWREQPNFSQDNDFDTKNAKAASYMRLSVGCTDPRAIVGANAP